MKNMRDLISEFPQNILDALSIADNVKLSEPASEIRNVVICGMGGSGIGGRLVSEWIAGDCPVPVLTVNEYELPAFVDGHTLIIASSYSGNTEETLFAVREATSRGSMIIGVCSGGELQRFCEKNSYDCIIVPGGNPPRTALAFSIVQLSRIFTALKLTSIDLLAEIRKGHDRIVSDAEDIHTEARRLAEILRNKTIAVYAGSNYNAVSIRARQQFNENSKELGWQHVIPEMNHNELVGWGGGDERYAALFLQTNDLSVRNQRRFEISVERVQSKTPFVAITEARGATRVERSIYLIHVIDWTSLYLSELKNGNPIEIEIIDYLKDELSKL